MLIIGLVIAAILGPLYSWRNTEKPTVRRYGIASAVAVAGAAVTPIAMGQCGFAADATGVDALFAYGLMAVGALLARARSEPAATAWAGGSRGCCCLRRW